ncbi:hypothetical protein Peur_008681 [Populus x canadensis]
MSAILSSMSLKFMLCYLLICDEGIPVWSLVALVHCTGGCPFGESCHFLHHVPGGYNVVAQMMNLGPTITPPSRSLAAPLPVPNGSALSTVKGRLWILGGRVEQPPPGPGTNFGVFATTTRINVDASLAAFIIGKGGVHSIHICNRTGVKLSIKEHETNPNLKNIELEGSFEQIAQASKMVEELVKVNSAKTAAKTSGGRGGHANPGSNNKTKLCDNFAKGSCTFGQRCHFAHGAAELRKTVVLSMSSIVPCSE